MITKIDASNDILLVGENDENRWNKKKTLVYWNKVGEGDIGNYAARNKINIPRRQSALNKFEQSI